MKRIDANNVRVEDQEEGRLKDEGEVVAEVTEHVADLVAPAEWPDRAGLGGSGHFVSFDGVAALLPGLCSSALPDCSICFSDANLNPVETGAAKLPSLAARNGLEKPLHAPAWIEPTATCGNGQSPRPESWSNDRNHTESAGKGALTCYETALPDRAPSPTSTECGTSRSTMTTTALPIAGSRAPWAPPRAMAVPLPTTTSPPRRTCTTTWASSGTSARSTCPGWSTANASFSASARPRTRRSPGSTTPRWSRTWAATCPSRPTSPTPSGLTPRSGSRSPSTTGCPGSRSRPASSPPTSSASSRSTTSTTSTTTPASTARSSCTRALRWR